MPGSNDGKATSTGQTPCAVSRPLLLLGLVVATSALVGNIKHIPRLADWFGSGVVASPSGAIAGIFLGLAALVRGSPRKIWARISMMLGLVTLLLAGAILLENFSGLNLHVDQVVSKAAHIQSPAPNKTGMLPCFAFALLALATLGLGASGQDRMRRFIPAFSITAGAIALLPLIGYIFQAEPLFANGFFMRMPVQIALIILLLSIGLLARVPDLEPVHTLKQLSPAGLLARRALPFVIGLPAVLGIVCRLSRDLGWLGPRMGLPLFVFTLVTLFCALIWWWAGALTIYEQTSRSAQEALRCSEQKLATELEARKRAEIVLTRTLDTAAAGLTRCSRDLRYTSANPAYARLIGVPVERIVGCPICEVIGEKAFQTIKPFVERVLRGEPVQYETEIHYSPSGARHVHATYTPDILPDGEIVGWVASIIDITDRKQGEQALRDSETRLRLARDAAQLGIYDWNIISGEITWDDRMRELWGASSLTPITRDFAYASIHPEDRDNLRLTVNCALDPAGSGKFSAEYRIVPSGGGPARWVVSAGQTQFVNGQAVRMVGAIQDITDRKEFQAELERLVVERTAKLEELIGELEHFSNTITHDMRAPLRAMRAFAESALELNGSDLQQQQLLLSRIINASKRMDLLIVDALRYNSAVRQRLTVGPVNVSQLLRGMLESYPELQLWYSNIHIQPDMPLVIGNEAGLTQCFSNLLNNSLKFMAPGVTPEIRVFAEEVNEPCPMVRFWVQDNGIGISEQLLPRLFQMFTRGSKEYEGTGIGLALVRKVIQRMGGQVGVESSGKGSRFWIELQPATPPSSTTFKSVQNQSEIVSA